ncbi:hypothetical protein LY78DRAFT_135904 [Colletotrichum sublineola]|nr:hypothetical protein LY78DRAFT_135904 [Colletotrichum sublineola]
MGCTDKCNWIGPRRHKHTHTHTHTHTQIHTRSNGGTNQRRLGLASRNIYATASQPYRLSTCHSASMHTFQTQTSSSPPRHFCHSFFGKRARPAKPILTLLTCHSMMSLCIPTPPTLRCTGPLDCHLICPASSCQLRGKRRIVPSQSEPGIEDGCEIDEQGFAVAFCTGWISSSRPCFAFLMGGLSARQKVKL